MDITEASLKVLLCNGKASTYDYWSPKFATRACTKKTSPIFLGAKLVPPKNGNDTALLIIEGTRTDVQKKTTKDFDLYSSAYNELIMATYSNADKGKIAFSLCITLALPQT